MRGEALPAGGRPGEPAGRDGTPIPGPTGQRMVIKIGGGASRGAYSLIEYEHAAGAAGPPPHLHREHEESFYVLEGELTLAIGTDTVTLGAGQSAVVPRGVVHQPSNTSDGPVRFLFLNSPPMDEFFVQLSAAVANAGGRLSAEKLRELGDRHDSIFVSLPASGPVSMHNEDS